MADKTEWLHVRVTPSDRRLVERAAAIADERLAGFVRRTVIECAERVAAAPIAGTGKDNQHD